MSYQEYRPSQFQVLPPVVKNILIINIIFFLASTVMGMRFDIELSDYLGLHYFASEKFRIYQLITYMFMHGGFMHIFFNMFALWMFGNVLENYWGGKRFLIYYLVTGVGAALVHYTIYYFELMPTVDFINQYLAHPDLKQFEDFFSSNYLKVSSVEIQSHVKEFITRYNAMDLTASPAQKIKASLDFMTQYKNDLYDAPVVIGASGAVFGILLAFGMLFPNTMLYIYFAIPIKAKYFVIIYGAIELYQGISSSPGDNVAHFAHLGGMLFGFFLIKYWNKKLNKFY